MENWLIIVLIIVGVLLFLFIVYLIIGLVIAHMNLGCKFLKGSMNKHLENNDNIYLTIMDTNFDKKNGLKEVSIHSYDKTILKGFEYTNKKESHLYFLMAHGYGSCHLEQTIMIQHLIDKYPLNLLLIDQRAQGVSDGKYCTMGDRESKDVICWVNYLKEKDKDAQVILYGNSLGAATVLLTASRDNKESALKGVIGDSSFTNAYVEFKKVITKDLKVPAFIGLYPLNLSCIIFHHFNLKKSDVIGSVKDITIPTLLIHANEDKFIPPEHLDLIYNELPNNIKKEKVMFSKGGHCLAVATDKERYYKLIDSFIEENLIK